ncbi:hypothetical protein [Chamaesiphon minutus]|uniref:Uncharacterized protein n=1 Tax=Chamaesiphon minutus (strain ATCC 27169 / PCC 6605) TaxID=1173020 RepID=K9UR71_CHAP6|nr:hypothetical protein [Chamaesiphon minutus]AFY96749.1 hypothetical protein Cha6605_5901 [Chamaesiphon minutus PCC 6605]
MAGQICWISKLGSNGQLSLHLRLESYHPWKPHTAFPHLCVPDYQIPNGTKGWATCQKLLQAGWTIISTEQARQSLERPASSWMNLATLPGSGSTPDPQFG